MARLFKENREKLNLKYTKIWGVLLLSFLVICAISSVFFCVSMERYGYYVTRHTAVPMITVALFVYVFLTAGITAHMYRNYQDDKENLLVEQLKQMNEVKVDVKTTMIEERKKGKDA